MTEKKPEAGEFWECNERVKIVGTLSDGATVGETSSGSIRTFKHDNGWRHLPECDSFDWQPETFPQWYEPLLDACAAYGIRTSKTELIVVHRDGSQVVREWQSIDANRKQITQAEAEARVKKPEPVDSPDDWVTQDRVPDRPGVDQWRWVRDGIVSSLLNWVPSRAGQHFYGTHGCKKNGSTFEVRCRRKDLPPLPEQTQKREYVRILINQARGSVSIVHGDCDIVLEGCDEIRHDGTGFYLAD